MNDDIDDILERMFRGGKLNFGSGSPAGVSGPVHRPPEVSANNPRETGGKDCGNPLAENPAEQGADLSGNPSRKHPAEPMGSPAEKPSPLLADSSENPSGDNGGDSRPSSPAKGSTAVFGKVEGDQRLGRQTPGFGGEALTSSGGFEETLPRLTVTPYGGEGGSAESEREELFRKMQRINENLQSSLQEDIEALTRETNAQLQEITAHLAADQLEAAKPKIQELPRKGDSLKSSLEEDFRDATLQVKKTVIGQNAFVEGVGMAFRRPLVVGQDPEMPANRCVILGKQGTGRHLTLEQYGAVLTEKGILHQGGLYRMDLSRYRLPGSEKRFIQDLYAAVSSPARLLVFEGFERCHAGVRPLVSALFIHGKLALEGRYVQQKGVLTEIGSALVKEAVSAVTAPGKYLFLLTDQSEKTLMDAFGAGFLTACGDICRTDAFQQEDLQQIARGLIHSFCQDAKKRLGCDLRPEPETERILAKRFVPDIGVNGMIQHLGKLRLALENHKLSHPGLETGILSGDDGGMFLRLSAGNLYGEEARDQGKEAMAEVKEELQEIVGLSTVKEYIYALEDNFKIQQLRRLRGMKAEFPSMHMIFTGNPGTGKTTIARIVSRYLKAIGVLSGGQLVEVTRADLVGRYVGHTAPLTQSAIQSALGGVLFIDEAYALYRGKEDSFGLEAIDTLVKGMEDHRDNLLVILAGYSMEMEMFLQANSGLKSRFPNLIEFPDYTAQELLDITKSLVRQKGYVLDEACEEPLYVYYDLMQTTGDPRTNGNGRMARNKVEEAILNGSRRNLSADPETADLERLTLPDFVLS